MKAQSSSVEREDSTPGLFGMMDAIDQALLAALPGAEDPSVPITLAKAMRYTIEKGKRIRPLLTVATGVALGARVETLLPFACAVELVHTYSLIHDDLPALDNDSVRRGRPTCHAVFGEAAAILAGDAMLAEAFAILARGRKSQAVPNQTLLEIIEEIAESAGARGLVGGQVMDLESEGGGLKESEVEKIHLRKTARLIMASVRVGARVAGATAEELDRLTRYGQNLGLAFQIADDVLDLVGGVERTGKVMGRDLEKEKANYASTVGLSASRSRVEMHLEHAVSQLEDFGEKAEPLRRIALSVRDRIRSGEGEWERF